MAFPDEDVARLKAQIERVPDRMAVGLHGQEFRALLARLEAAEKVCEEMQLASQNTECSYCLSAQNDDNIEIHAPDCPLIGNLEAWRKAAGKP